MSTTGPMRTDARADITARTARIRSGDFVAPPSADAWPLVRLRAAVSEQVVTVSIGSGLN